MDQCSWLGGPVRGWTPERFCGKADLLQGEGTHRSSLFWDLCCYIELLVQNRLRGPTGISNCNMSQAEFIVCLLNLSFPAFLHFNKSPQMQKPKFSITPFLFFYIFTTKPAAVPTGSVSKICYHLLNPGLCQFSPDTTASWLSRACALKKYDPLAPCLKSSSSSLMHFRINFRIRN